MPETVLLWRLEKQHETNNPKATARKLEAFYPCLIRFGSLKANYLLMYEAVDFLVRAFFIIPTKLARRQPQRARGGISAKRCA